MHVIKLDGYNATTENGEKLELGTFDSFGEEQLQIVKAPDWVNLSVIATFNPPNRKPVQAVVDSVTGVIKVPKEATAGWYGVGTIVFIGFADGVQRISSDVEYIVRRHSNASGTEPAEPTPDLLQQVLTLSKDAQTAAKNAEDADNGKFIGPVGPQGIQGEKGDTGERGPQGEQGVQGVQGEKGDTGAQGSVGETGPVGPKGDTGPQGERGEQGPQGEVGPEGPAGKDGVQIDDAAVSEDAPWSSKHIIDMLCPPLEESGNPVVCYPVAGYPLGVKASWEPVQEGSGTPSPENIRPIKGRDCVTVERCGENLSKISDISTPNKTLTPVELPTEIVADIEISFDTLNAEIKNVGTAFFLNKADGKYACCDTGGRSADKILFERKGHGWNFEPCIPAGKTVAGIACDGYRWHERMVAAKPAGGGYDPAYTMKIRSGCEGGGKGPLVQNDLSATLATHQDQTVFAPARDKCLPVNMMLATRCKALGRGTGLGVGDIGEPQYTITAGHEHAVAYSFDSLASNSMKSSNPHSGCREVDTAKTLDCGVPDPSRNQGGVAIVQKGNGK